MLKSKIVHGGVLLTLLFGVALAKPFEVKYVGIGAEKEGYHVWGSSPVIGPEGKTHLYVAQWKRDTHKNFNGWYKDCEIAHYVGDTPEGPFAFVRTAVPDKDGTFNSPHNPTIKHLDGRYVLTFIVNENDDLSTQRIVMLVADDLNDDWKPAASAEPDGTILRPSTDPEVWNYSATLGVSNPSLLKYKGKYLLYNKSVIPFPDLPRKKGKVQRRWMYGLAVADKLEGPYIHQKEQVTSRDVELEDAYAFTLGGQVHLLSRDMRGSLGGHGGGLLWKSTDGGKSFDTKVNTVGYKELVHYVGKKSLGKAKSYRGSKKGNLERPQILVVDNKPTYLFLATGINTKKNYGSCSHIFKIKASESPNKK